MPNFTCLILIAAALARPAVSDDSGPTRINPDWENPTTSVSRRLFGHNAVWSRGGLGLWSEKDKSANPEALALVSALQPSVLRFPGGTRAMRYHFDQAIGRYESRTAQCDPFTGLPDNTSYGLDEFLRLVETLRATKNVSAEVTLVSPWVDGTPQEVAAMVAYVNASDSSGVVIGRDANGRDWGRAADWARRRRENGHEKPYQVAFLEVGNEQYLPLPVGPAVSCGRPSRFHQSERWEAGVAIPTTAKDHAGQVALTANLVRLVDPSIKIGASAFSRYDMESDAATAIAPLDLSRGTGDAWNTRLIADAGDSFDFFILHPYELGVPIGRPPLALTLRKTVHELRKLAPAKPIAVTEFGYFTHGGTLMDAMLTTDVLQVALEENLLMTLRHILIEDQGESPFARSAAILGPQHEKMPAYFIEAWLASSLSGRMVRLPGMADEKKKFSAYATRDLEKKELALVIDSQPSHRLPLSIEVALPPGQWDGQLRTMSGPSLISTLNRMRIIEKDIVARDRLNISLTAHSIAVVHLTERR